MNSDIHAVFARRITLASGETMMVNPIVGQESVLLKLITGGTLEISPVNGFTLRGGVTTPLNGITGGQAAGSWYPMDTTPLAMAIRGPFCLVASGATCVVALLYGRTAGNQQYT